VQVRAGADDGGRLCLAPALLLPAVVAADRAASITRGGFIMRKALGLIVVLLLVLSVVPAWAGDIEGKIQTIDPADRMLTLEDGTKLWIAEGVAMDTLKEGAKVKASYEDRDGKNVVTGFEVSE
jgi:hypothetical protein